MVNIDLKTSEERTAVEKSTDVGLIAAFILTAITLVIYGGVYYLEKSAIASNQAKQNEIVQASQKLNGPESKQVIDFQNRLKIAKGYVGNENALLEILSELEKTVIKEVYITSLDYTKSSGAVNLLLVANSFEDAAKQISSFKSSTVFGDVSTSGAKTNNSDGKVGMDIKMRIN